MRSPLLPMSGRRAPAARPMLRRVHAFRKAPHGWHKAAARRVAAKQAPPRVQPHSPAPPGLPRSLGRHAHFGGMLTLAVRLPLRDACLGDMPHAPFSSHACASVAYPLSRTCRVRAFALAMCPPGRYARSKELPMPSDVLSALSWHPPGGWCLCIAYRDLRGLSSGPRRQNEKFSKAAG